MYYSMVGKDHDFGYCTITEVLSVMNEALCSQVPEDLQI